MRIRTALVIMFIVFLQPSHVCGNEPADKAFTKSTYTYKEVGGLEIKADVYRPNDDAVRPVLVWIHGGALIMGGREGIEPHLADLAGREGLILVSIDYRLAPQAKIDAITSDVADAMTWIRQRGPELFDADPDRIVVAGGSAGGYLTLFTGTLRPAPTALVAYYGYGTLDSSWYAEPSEFYRKTFPIQDRDEAWAAAGDKLLANAGTRPEGGRFYLYLRQHGEWPKVVTGFDPKTQRDQIKPYCPTYNITADYPPTMLLHGTADTDVPHIESVMFAEALTKHGVEHDFVSLEGLGHGLVPGNSEVLRNAVRDAKARAERFISHHLTGEVH